MQNRIPTIGSVVSGPAGQRYKVVSIRKFDPSQPRATDGKWSATVYRGIWGPDKPHEMSGDIESWSAEKHVAESYALDPNDPVLLAQAGGNTSPTLITGHLSPDKMFQFGSEPKQRVDDVLDRLRDIDPGDKERLIEDMDKFNEKDNPRFNTWEYGDSKVFQGMLRDRGFDAIASPGAFVDTKTNTSTFPTEYRILKPSALKRTNAVPLAKAFNPDQARGPDGKWTSGGGSGEEPFIQQYLKMTSKVGSTKDKFILEHGKQYKYDASSFEGPRDEAQMCYMNAGRIALSNSKRTYVEGYITVHGVPLQHAWTVDSKGKVHDSTLTHDKNVGGYFGVPFTTDYVAKTALKTKVWGVISHTNPSLFKAVDKTKIIKFNPDQARDDHGRWTIDGSSTTPAEDLLALHHDGTETMEDVNKQLTPAQKYEMEQAAKGLNGQVPTNVQFMGPDGKYLPERADLHNKILSEMFSKEDIAHAMTKPGETPVLTLTGGRPASGKTSTLRKELGDTDKHSFYISADTIQEHLPHYDGKKAGLYNGEAQDIALQAEHIARANRLNVTYDATLKSQQPALDRVKAYHDDGYKVNGYFVHTSPVTSAVRSAQRYMDTGRYVPPEVSFNSRSNEKTFDTLIPHLDKWAIYDNNGTSPRLVARGHR